MPYYIKDKCIYKKGTNEKVGCTKGSVKKYMQALHANIKESMKLSNLLDELKVEYLKGCCKDK